MIYSIVNLNSNIYLPRKENYSSRVSFCALSPKQISQSVLCQKSMEKLEDFVEKYDFKKQKPVQHALKRVTDVIGGSVGLLLSAPVIIISGIMIKAESKGPMIFKQKRVGLYGKEFVILKMRTMATESTEGIEKAIKEVEPQKELKIHPPDISKITAIGEKLRGLGFDELPQFINVIKGDMSLIGPRPLIKKDIEVMEKHYPDGVRRFAVKPGLQLPYRTPKTQRLAQNLALEKKYLDNWSLKTDFKFFFEIIKDTVKMKNY